MKSEYGVSTPVLLKNARLYLAFVILWLSSVFLQVKHGDSQTGSVLGQAILYGVPCVAIIANFLWLGGAPGVKRALWSLLAAGLQLILMQVFILTLGMWFYSAIGGTK